MEHWLKQYIDDPQKPIDFSTFKKKKCWHNWTYLNGDIVCKMCGLINTKLCVITPDRNVNFEFWPRTYLRQQYFDALFNKITGRDPLLYSDTGRLELIKDMPEPCDWYEVYQKFKEWSLKDWWICWNVFSYCDKYIDYKPIHYKLLCYVDNKWEDSNRSKKKINVFYTLYKIVELTECSVRWVPMKLRLIALTRLDSEWKQICEKLGWKFIPTSKKLEKFHFISTWGAKT